MEEKQLIIEPSIMAELPMIVKQELKKLTPEKQHGFIEEYKRKAKSKGTAYILWFLLGFHYIYFKFSFG